MLLGLFEDLALVELFAIKVTLPRKVLRHKGLGLGILRVQFRPVVGWVIDSPIIGKL